MARPIPLASLAKYLDCDLDGDGHMLIHGFGSLAQARDDELVFLRDAQHREALGTTRSRAVIAARGVDVEGRAALRSSQPAQDFFRLVTEFAPFPRPQPGIAPAALVDPTARVDASASIAPGAVIGPGCSVGPHSVVAANVSLGAQVRVGADCWIHAGAVLCEETEVGDRVVLQPGVVLGSAGFGLAADAAGQLVSIAQRGRVVVEDDVEIGANTCVDRATLDETRIRRGAKIDNLVQIGHNCEIGENAVIVAQTGLAGGTSVGAGAIVMAQVGSAGHLRIGAGAFVGARSGLHSDVPDRARVYGSPAMEERGWHRVSAALKRLPELIKRVRRLEKALENRTGGDGGAGGDGASGGDSEPD